MNGFNNLPNKTDQNTFIFYANADSASISISGSFQAWNVPEYATFLHFTVIGGGGGGGAGYYRSFTTSGSGGGGGAPGGMVAVSIPAILLPKTLYLQVGYGGLGGAAATTDPQIGNSGSNGTISYVCLYPEINAGSVLIQSSNTAPGGGAGGGINTTSATGTAITIADTTNMKWLGIVGNTVAQTAGGTGAAGSTANINGTAVTYVGLLTGGAGGGNMRSGSAGGGTGGTINMTNILSYIAVAVNGGSAFNTTEACKGSNGFFSWKPFIATGGAGGAGYSITGATIAPDGGDGAYGCGGGGGGARSSAPSKGGKGGNGLIIIAVS
jgi:hypothetical protein